jgi:hypothetical protein
MNADPNMQAIDEFGQIAASRWLEWVPRKNITSPGIPQKAQRLGVNHDEKCPSVQAINPSISCLPNIICLSFGSRDRALRAENRLSCL